MAGLAIITEACIDVKDRACVDVCPVQCIYEFDPAKNVLFSEAEAGSGDHREHATRRTPTRSPCSATASSTSTSRSARRAPPATSPTSVRSGAIYSEEHVPDGSRRARSTTPRTRTRATTTRSSSSTAGTSSRTSGPCAEGPVRARQSSGKAAGPSQSLGCRCSDNRRCSDQVVEVRDGTEWRRPFAGA